MYLGLVSLLLSSSLFASMPASEGYQLGNYGFGSGGTSNSSSETYSINGTTGEVSNTQSASETTAARSGNNNVQQADVPLAPTFTNPDNFYNKLRFVINPSDNPSDTQFSIAISTDNFVTTQYVQNDNTVASTKGLEDYQTYAAWGGASGQLVVGLASSTSYAIRVNAFQGSFTETEYGPSASAATAAPSITFDIDLSATDTDTNPPYATSFGNLLPNAITDTAERVWIDLDTNADQGAKVYLTSANGGLRSPAENFTITSASADLAGAATGYGAQGSAVGQTSGGPLTVSAPYNVGGSDVGVLNTSLREIFAAAGPINSGRGSITLKAKATALTPASNDYTDTLTFTAAAAF